MKFPTPAPADDLAAFFHHPARRVFSLGIALALLALCSGCTTLQPSQFAGERPRFEPEKFFAGRTHSWGVFENTGGQPAKRFTTDAEGHMEGGELVLAQRFTYEDGKIQRRLWHLRRLDAHRYEATASDVVGTARGEAYGNAFHWRYTVALQPGNPLSRVQLEQWMYGVEDGRRMVNRAEVRKWGVRVAGVTEYFQKLP